MPEPSKKEVLRVGLVQLQPTRDVSTNLQLVLQAVSDAAQQQAELIVLPENALCIGTNQMMRDAAVSIDGAEIMAIRAAARDAMAHVVVGGFKQRTDKPLLRNTLLVIDPQGQVQGTYNKIHLFDAVVNGTTFRASDVESAGDHLVIANVNGVRVGLSICFDLRFPEMFRQLARAGAQVILVPAAFTRTTGNAHWEVLLRARAIENQTYIVASATIASPDATAAGFETWGHAMVAGPWGDVLADLGEQDYAVKVIDLDLTKIEAIRHKLPVLNTGRPDVYQSVPVEI